MGRDILKKKLNLIDKIIRNNMNIITLRSAYKVKEYHIQPCKQPNGLNLPFVKKVRYDSEGNSEMILTDAERNDPKSAYFIPEDEDIVYGSGTAESVEQMIELIKTELKNNELTAEFAEDLAIEVDEESGEIWFDYWCE